MGEAIRGAAGPKVEARIMPARPACWYMLLDSILAGLQNRVRGGQGAISLHGSRVSAGVYHRRQGPPSQTWSTLQSQRKGAMPAAAGV